MHHDSRDLERPTHQRHQSAAEPELRHQDEVPHCVTCLCLNSKYSSDWEYRQHEPCFPRYPPLLDGEPGERRRRKRGTPRTRTMIVDSLMREMRLHEISLRSGEEEEDGLELYDRQPDAGSRIEDEKNDDDDDEVASLDTSVRLSSCRPGTTAPSREATRRSREQTAEEPGSEDDGERIEAGDGTHRGPEEDWRERPASAHLAAGDLGPVSRPEEDELLLAEAKKLTSRQDVREASATGPEQRRLELEHFLERVYLEACQLRRTDGRSSARP